MKRCTRHGFLLSGLGACPRLLPRASHPHPRPVCAIVRASSCRYPGGTCGGDFS